MSEVKMVSLTGLSVQVALVVFLVKREINLFLLVTCINKKTNRLTDHEKRFHGLRSKGEIKTSFRSPACVSHSMKEYNKTIYV